MKTAPEIAQKGLSGSSPLAALHQTRIGQAKLLHGIMLAVPARWMGRFSHEQGSFQRLLGVDMMASTATGRNLRPESTEDDAVGLVDDALIAVRRKCRPT